MSVERVSISGIRNLAALDLDTSSDLILFQGNNGSGKTSLIEALFLLGRGSSFRSRELDHVINYDLSGFVCFARLSQGRQLGVSRDKAADRTLVKINGEIAHSLSELAIQIPLLLVTPLTFDLLNGGPAERRRFLDWGVFHVEHSYKEIWQRWRKQLLQRNKLLKNGRISRSELRAWTLEYIESSMRIDEYRRRYFEELIKQLEDDLIQGSSFTNDLSAQTLLKYERGWSTSPSLEEQLERSADLDLRRGFTSVGPHKADLRITSHGISAKEVLSRGQQKVLITHLLLAQLQILKDRRETDCVVLIDDLGAELDQANQAQLLQSLLEKNAQVFATMVDPEQAIALNELISRRYKTQMFHVEHGKVSPLGKHLKEIDG